MEGVSQSTRKWSSSSSIVFAGVPLSRRRRDWPSSLPAVPVPISTSPCMPSSTAKTENRLRTHTGHIGIGRAAQSTSGGKEGDGLHEIGLAGPVFPVSTM